MISDSVELCETAVCFLHIQLIGTNVVLTVVDEICPFFKVRHSDKRQVFDGLRGITSRGCAA